MYERLNDKVKDYVNNENLAEADYSLWVLTLNKRNTKR